MTTRDVLLCWRFDPLAIVVGAGMAVMVVRTWHARVSGWRALSAGLALACIAVGLMSPVAVLADGYLFSAHMLQHLLLVLVVPPLALLALEPFERPGRAPGFRRTALAWGLGVGAMWAWHEPTLCNAAARDPLVHAAQEVSLLGMGTAFWWPIVTPRAHGRLGALGAIIYLFTACIACTLLGVIVTFSPVEVCSVFSHPIDRLGVMPLIQRDWGLGAATDQQLGGLLMWVPACLVYGVGIMGALTRMYRDEDAALAPRGES